jgi:hypothetical protein
MWQNGGCGVFSAIRDSTLSYTTFAAILPSHKHLHCVPPFRKLLHSQVCGLHTESETRTGEIHR